MLYDNDGVFTAGLTGMSGAGKTTACSVFSASGFAVIDCDVIARGVVEKGRPALAEIAARFSTDVLRGDGTLDRRKLGDIVFSDSASLAALNSIIYPFITFDIIAEVHALSGRGSRLVLLDAPTLFESGADRLCDTVVCVTADKGYCTERIMLRDGLTREQAEKRLSSQHDAAYYISRSSYSAENSGTLADFERSLSIVAEKIRNEASVLWDEDIYDVAGG